MREGLERAIVDQSVVLIHKATGQVLDIIENVLTGGRSGSLESRPRRW